MERNDAKISLIAPSTEKLWSLKCMRMVKVVTHTYSCVSNNSALLQNRMKFAVQRGPYSGSLGLSLRHCSSFSFGVENVLLSRFDSNSNIQWINECS